MNAGELRRRPQLPQLPIVCDLLCAFSQPFELASLSFQLCARRIGFEDFLEHAKNV